MNWLSAFDIIPLAAIVFCAIDQLRQIVAYKQPITTLFLVLVAVGAFRWIAVRLHGQNADWWELLVDFLLSVLFCFSTYSRHLKGLMPRASTPPKSTYTQR